MRLLAIALSFLLSIFLSSCTLWQSTVGFFNPNFNNVEATVEDYDNSFQVIHTAQATAIVQDFAQVAERMHHLKLRHAHTYYDDGIHAIQLEFISQDLIEMCEARKLIVDMTEDLLAKLNQDSILAMDFAHFPFRPDNLEIYITFESYFGKYVDPWFIHWICMEDGQIDYYIFDIRNKDKNNWHVRHEAYSTSREIVVYEREAERKYKELYEPNVNLFGNQRYYPTTMLPKVRF